MTLVAEIPGQLLLARTQNSVRKDECVGYTRDPRTPPVRALQDQGLLRPRQRCGRRYLVWVSNDVIAVEMQEDVDCTKVERANAIAIE